MTDDIFSYLQRCNLESLGESKTKSTKENKLTSVLGSIWNGNAYVDRGTRVHNNNNQGLAGNLEWTGWGRKAFLCQT